MGKIGRGARRINHEAHPTFTYQARIAVSCDVLPLI